MKIEHFALQVAEPAAMADWYVKHLGFSISRAGGPPAHARFLKDSSGSVMMEIYRNPQATVPDYGSMNPLLLHVAFISKDLAADRARLVKGGATVVDDIAKTAVGDDIVMLRDPWGTAVQLVKRADPMLSQI
jgi:glyoxylase I family protein